MPTRIKGSRRGQGRTSGLLPEESWIDSFLKTPRYDSEGESEEDFSFASEKENSKTHHKKKKMSLFEKFPTKDLLQVKNPDSNSPKVRNKIRARQAMVQQKKRKHKTDILRRHRISVENADGDQVCRKGTFDNFFYSTPNSKLLTILIVVTVVLVIVFIIIFKYVTKCCNLSDSTNGTVSTYLSIVGVPVGVVLSFIVATTWSSFADAQTKEGDEGVALLQLYKILDFLPGGEPVQIELRKYTARIINIEFPSMELGQFSRKGLDIIFNIGDMIYSLEPTNDRESGLFDKAIDLYQRVISLRVARFGYTVNGIAPELWWVLIFGVIIVIFMSFFMYCTSTTLQIIMTAMSAAVLVSLLFLVVALNFPYRGDFGLDSLPFQIALANIDADILEKKIEAKRKDKLNEDTSDSCSEDDSDHFTEKRRRAKKRLAGFVRDLRKGRLDSVV